VAFAVIVGAVAFLNGLASLFLLLGVGGSPQRKLFEINAFLGTAIVTMSLGGVLVYHAASSLGGASSSPMKFLTPWALLPLFPVLVILGQLQVDHPERLPWLFPLLNVGIVSIPSLTIALVVARRYLRFNGYAWPISWREWASGFIYGAVGATLVASIINTAYLYGVGALLIHLKGHGSVLDLERNLPSLPKAWGMLFDLSALSVVAPINEEFWKGMLVAFFFFRKGGAARCFLWGVLAGAGFNLLETFQNSLVAVSPEQLSERTISNQWWLFATARAGTGAIHSLATGLSALGFYGIFRRKWRFALGYPGGMLTHGTWNFLNYTLWGDAIFSQAGPDSRALDVLSIVGLLALFAICVVLLWEIPRRVRDGFPAPIYRALGMLPAPR
jgi:hypothetical protein